MHNPDNSIPSSVGSRADLKADVNIADVFGGYFSNPEVAQAFVDAGIESIEDELPKNVRLADYGGGQGFLTKFVADWLKLHGHDVDAFVLDSNNKSLDVAKNDGLQTYQCNLENCDFQDADLVIMRAVNHYNPVERQSEILGSALKSLKDGGLLLSQISSGSKENCELRSKIANLQSLGRAANGENYHWTSIEEYRDMLEKVGFKDNVVVGHAPDWQWSPEDQWDRFHEKESQDAERSGDTKKIDEINAKKKLFLDEAYSLIKKYVEKYGLELLDTNFDEAGKATIKYKTPIIKSKK